MYSFFDAHCDTITELYLRKQELLNNKCHISIKGLLRYQAPVQVFSIWLSKREEYLEDTVSIIDFFDSQMEKYDNFISHGTKKGDIEKNKKAGMITAILGIEGGESLNGDIENLNMFYERGVRIITLTWNNENSLAGGCGSKLGLTPFGREVVHEMNQKGMVIDVSHLSQQGFWDVVESSKKPFVASHSNAVGVCDHERNLSDEQIKVIAKTGGVIGINLYPPFLGEGECSILDAVKHIDYILRLAGEDCIGLGCDFDGINKPPRGIYSVSDLKKLINILDMMYGRKITEKILEKNMRGLFQRCGCEV